MNTLQDITLKLTTPQSLLILSVASECFGLFRHNMVCYGCKVIIDCIKESVKIIVINNIK